MLKALNIQLQYNAAMSSVNIEKFHKLGQKGDKDALVELMNDIDESEIEDLVKALLRSSNITETWNYILISFSESPESHQKRLTLVFSILRELEKRDISQTSINAVITVLCLELGKFIPGDLAKICHYCLEEIRSSKPTKFVWKDLLPKILEVLANKDIFTYDELDYTGEEYKTDFINSVCMSPWSPEVLTPLTQLFIDTPLSKEEHLKVTTKLCSYIKKMSPQELPPFIYQLLQFCKQQNCKHVFMKLQNYFTLKIYKNANVGTEDSPDSNSFFDTIESTDNADCIEAESTILFHIHRAASLGYECIREYLSFLKNMVKAPEHVLNAFQLTVLFTISNSYEETIFEIIRSCVVRIYNEDKKRAHSSWYREMVPSTIKLEEVISQVVHFSVEDRDLALSGLINFAFVLLGVGSALGQDVVAEKQWSLGIAILLKIVKRKRKIASTIIQTLSMNIVSKQNVSQYIECLYLISRSMPLLILENQRNIEDLLQITTDKQLFDALIPLTKFSLTVRDNLLIYLRKGLYSRSSETVQISVSGFLKLLTNLKITDAVTLSQNSVQSFSSGYSVFTQLSYKTTQNTVGNFNNEALCFQILNILNKCLMKQADIKSQLYEGLYDAVDFNAALGVPVLDLLWFHLEKYIISEDTLPPVDFEKLITCKEAQAISAEPLGKLIFAGGLICAKVVEQEDNNSGNVDKFIKVLDELSQKMVNCELVHFELDDGTDLLDDVPESQKKLLVLKEALCIYEALMGYKIYSWNEKSERQGLAVNSLFQGYNRLVQFSKSLSKPKKAGVKRKKNADKTTQETQESASKKSSKNIKLPDFLWNFQTVKKALELLYEPQLSWTTVSEANVVRTNKELHQHLMGTVLHLAQTSKHKKELDTAVKKLHFDHITAIATIIYKRIIKKLAEFTDFDAPTAVLAMECFNLLINLIINQYKNNLSSFLNTVAFDEQAQDLVKPLREIIQIYQEIYENEDFNDAVDLEMKKIPLIAINTLTTLVNEIPTSETDLSNNVLDWLKNFACNNTLTLKTSTAFVNLFFNTHLKYKVSLALLNSMSVSIREMIDVITEEEQTIESFKIINESSVHHIFLSLCNIVGKFILDDIDSIILRLKSEHSVLKFDDNYENSKKNFKLKEKGVCCQLYFVVDILTNLANLQIPSGNLSESLFKSLILLYGSLSSLTKYFNSRFTKTDTFQDARFEKLVRLSGKQLSPAIYKFILYLEENRKDSQNTQAKKKAVDASALKSRVLRETRLIPTVIYEIEQFSKCVTQLSNKSKTDLSKYVGQGVVRDFRIMDLKETLKDRQDDEPSVSCDNETSMDESRTDGNTDAGDTTEVNPETDEDSDNECPVTKKTKT
ncbi:unnamed protein product [Phyllotreta striolata]|uniref:Fanconi anemia group I protein n=1 Tax=Phyllotreta striolata TaxID=444603 RepID=A0A9N9TE93_PHYSR|nr:unnamed protein product [Phyllotreta striolata]